MMAFWLAALALLLVAVVPVVWPLLRRGPGAEPRPGDTSLEALSVQLFRERLAELDGERATGALDAADYQRLRLELERNLLRETEGDAPGTAPRGVRRQGLPWVALAMVVALPVAGLLYTYYTSWRGPALEWIAVQERLGAAVAQALATPSALPPEATTDLANFARTLQAHVLRGGKRDPDALYLLGASYLELNRPDLAAQVLARAHRLVPGRDPVTLAYAQSLLSVEGGRLTLEAEGLLRQVLRRQPNHEGARMMLGFGAFNAGQYPLAIAQWRRLQAGRTGGSGNELLANAIAEAERRLAAATPPQAPADPPPAEEIQLTVTVDLDPGLRARVAAGDTLYVFAKAAHGPAAPLAVVRHSDPAFPLEVTLDDADAMVAHLNLSAFPQVVVNARLSKSGDVAPKAGDLQGSSEILDLAAGTRIASVVIDQVVP
ncbi:MAG: c-type cytochrome biogenesis protein CcmI [Candidatus Competibacterales bacterium]